MHLFSLFTEIIFPLRSLLPQLSAVRAVYGRAYAEAFRAGRGHNSPSRCAVARSRPMIYVMTFDDMSNGAWTIASWAKSSFQARSACRVNGACRQDTRASDGIICAWEEDLPEVISPPRDIRAGEEISASYPVASNFDTAVSNFSFFVSLFSLLHGVRTARTVRRWRNNDGGTGREMRGGGGRARRKRKLSTFARGNGRMDFIDVWSIIYNVCISRTLLRFNVINTVLFSATILLILSVRTAVDTVQLRIETAHIYSPRKSYYRGIKE